MEFQGQGQLFEIAPEPLIYTAPGECPTHCVKCRKKLTMSYEGGAGKGYRWEACQKCSQEPDPEFRRMLREAIDAIRGPITN